LGKMHIFGYQPFALLNGGLVPFRMEHQGYIENVIFVHG
jgi:hypothetical protein